MTKSVDPAVDVENTPQPIEVLHESHLSAKQWLLVVLCTLASMIEGFDIVAIAYTAPAISQDWGVSATDMGVVLSAGVLGMTLGAMFLSFLADRYGRRIMVSVSMLIAGIATSAVIFAGTVAELVVLRVVAGLALGLLVASLSPLVGEFSPRRHRTLIISVLIAAASLGAVIGGLLTSVIVAEHGWQSVFLYAGIITVVLGILIQLLVPESLAFTIKRHPELGLEKVNQTLLSLGQAPLAALPIVPESVSRESSTVFALLIPARRVTTILTWAAFFAGFLVVYFITSWMPQILTNAGLSQEKAIQATAAIPFGSLIGTLLIGWLAKWAAINRIIAAAFIAGTAVMLVLSFLVRDIASMSFSLIWIMLFLIGIFVMGAFSNLYNIALAVYPVQVRSTGLGWAAGLGRAGAVISPFLAGVLMGMGVSLPALFLYFAIPTVAAAGLVYLINMREMP